MKNGKLAHTLAGILAIILTGLGAYSLRTSSANEKEIEKVRTEDAKAILELCHKDSCEKMKDAIASNTELLGRQEERWIAIADTLKSIDDSVTAIEEHQRAH